MTIEDIKRIYQFSNIALEQMEGDIILYNELKAICKGDIYETNLTMSDLIDRGLTQISINGKTALRLD